MELGIAGVYRRFSGHAREQCGDQNSNHRYHGPLLSACKRARERDDDHISLITASTQPNAMPR